MTSNMDVDDDYVTSRVVLPGNQVPVNASSDECLKLGPGLTQHGDSVIAMKAGVLRHQRSGNRWWIESNQRRYIPAADESVIGVITSKSGDFYRVDIGSAHSAILPNLNKRSPQFAVGTLIYARVSLANKDMEPELECVNPTTGKSEGYGELKGGFVVKCSLGMCRRLLNQDPLLILRLLAEQFPFETATGLNGRVWINSSSIEHTIMLAEAIKTAEHMDDSQCREYVKRILAK